jgi:hypothetical protein
MKLQQIVGKASVPELIRHRLETSTFYSTESATRALRREFPHHVIIPQPRQINVQVKDKSFSVAVFKKIL